MSLVDARESLHAVAEHVLAPARHHATGRIGLRVLAGGFGTPVFPDCDGGTCQVLVRGRDLVVRTGTPDGTGGDERTTALTTVGAAAAFVGIEPGADPSVYAPVTPLRPDRPLALDPPSVHHLLAWFTSGQEALQQLRAAVGADTSTEIQLWPEHFDVALVLDEVNYGASPGDAEHPEPYVYVAPFVPRTGLFWNEPFGASRTRDEVPDVAAAVDFLLEGRERSR